MAETLLKFEPREKAGSQGARRMRRNGQVPGVVYGDGGPPSTVSVDHKALWDLLHQRGRNVIVSLVPGDDGEKGAQTTIIKELQHHPIRAEILHVDFHRISLTEKIVVEVALVVVGSAVGVREGGGVLEHMLHRVEVECLAGEIPDRIEVDVAPMNVGDALHVSDLVLEGDARIVTEGDRSVLVVVPPTVAKEPEEEAEAEVLAEEEEMLEPEVIERGKKEEPDEEGEEK